MAEDGDELLALDLDVGLQLGSVVAVWLTSQLTGAVTPPAVKSVILLVALMTLAWVRSLPAALIPWASSAADCQPWKATPL